MADSLSVTYIAAPDRYEQTPYRRCGHSGVDLPMISLGLWQNFGDATPIATQRGIIRRAFDLGITHFDLANNYGGTAPAQTFGKYDSGEPYGSAETNFGRILREDLRPYRDELLISTKAGWDMWPGPYGDWGSRKYLLASLDQSLRQMGVRLLIHQPSYSILDRWLEDDGLLDALDRGGIGCIAFSPLAQGLLTSRYLNGVPPGSRASRADSLSPDVLSDAAVGHLRALSEVARGRGQTLAQLALSWVLRDQRVTSALIGASRVTQLEENLGAIGGPALTPDELAAIDAHSVHAGIAV